MHFGSAKAGGVRSSTDRGERQRETSAGSDGGDDDLYRHRRRKRVRRREKGPAAKVEELMFTGMCECDGAGRGAFGAQFSVSSFFLFWLFFLLNS